MFCFFLSTFKYTALRLIILVLKKNKKHLAAVDVKKKTTMMAEW